LIVFGQEPSRTQGSGIAQATSFDTLLHPLALQRGVSPGWVSQVLGHGTMEITFRYYLRYIKDPTLENERLMTSMFEVPQKTLSESGESIQQSTPKTKIVRNAGDQKGDHSSRGSKNNDPKSHIK
jgi:hypothetical protein